METKNNHSFFVKKAESTLRRFRRSENTINIYCSCLNNFLKNRDVYHISVKDIESFLSIISEKYSSSTYNQYLNAILFFFKYIHKKRLPRLITNRPKKEQYIPTILDQKRLLSIIDSVENLKHRAILFIIYDNGLRISELINLSLMDVRTKCEKPHLIIRNSKGGKNRILLISDECLELIKRYYKTYHPKEYLFNGTGLKYSKTSIANILNSAMKKNGVKDRFRVHDLRHNFSTHCLINGTDIYHLSKYLGHSSVKTTEDFYDHLVPQNLVIQRCSPNRRNNLRVIHKAG